MAADNFVVLEIRDAGDGRKKGCALLAANSDSQPTENRDRTGSPKRASYDNERRFLRFAIIDTANFRVIDSRAPVSLLETSCTRDEI